MLVPCLANQLIAFKFFVQFTTYTACYCGVVLGAAASSLRKVINDDAPLDPHFIPAIVLAAFFGLFTSLMTLTSIRYILLNMTNVDMLNSRSKVYQLAVRVPRGTEATDRFSVVTYPLPRPGEITTNGRLNGTAVPRTARSSSSDARARPTTRDDLANRTFAILKTEPGENLWDLGAWRNWQNIMGPHLLDWVLPFRKSPCVNHESHDSFYPMGRALADVLARYELTGLAMATAGGEGAGLEMKEIGRAGGGGGVGGGNRLSRE